ncbi:MAG: PilT/PilU family type 4a pilus ATPase [Neisseriaceae bacterium]|nr:MAG: PilT/PilU family type 4a pilus ATPase [Neisseriaceae bacterium]
MNIHELLVKIVQQKASDLHLSPGLPPKIRFLGDIKNLSHDCLTKEDMASILSAITTPSQKELLTKQLEIDFSISMEDLARFRVNVFHTNNGIAMAFRPISNKIMTLEDIDAPNIFKKIVSHPRGLILVTGPTGSGKSTTLAAMIDYINENTYQHILTIEDPIEFIHSSKNCLINQRELNQNTLSFENALRSAMREDPDIILIGEMRDLETIKLALTAAETGHLVLATLHTTGAAKSINRIVDVFPGSEKEMIRTMLSESLIAVISQTLIKKADASGRVAAHEIMISNPAIKNLIRENKIAQINSCIQTGSASGMQTLEQSLNTLIKKGIISAKDVQNKSIQS